MDINSEYPNSLLSYRILTTNNPDIDYLPPKEYKITPLGGAPKRAFDLLVAAVALCVAVPVMLATSIVIKMLDGGPVFFVQNRLGFAGQSFPCFKFRTMEVGAEEKLMQYLLVDVGAAEEWKSTRKLKRDPRLTLIGSALRRSSIDELPQLLNVLLGHMSMVGPRPVVAEEIQYYGGEAEAYFSTRPGLTGEWQISGRNDLSYAERVRLDYQYCTRWSFTNDLLILLKTLPIILLRRGSY